MGQDVGPHPVGTHRWAAKGGLVHGKTHLSGPSGKEVEQNLGVYVGKTENHRGTTSLFSSNFSRLAEKITRKQRDRSEMIRGSTNINWVCEKRVSGRIDAVYDKHSILEVG